MNLNEQRLQIQDICQKICTAVKEIRFVFKTLEDVRKMRQVIFYSEKQSINFSILETEH